MIHRLQDQEVEIRSNLRGGTGDLSFRHLFSTQDLGQRAQMLAVVTLEPGQSIGPHPHQGNGEAYVVLSGSPTVTQDGVDTVLTAGDCQFCADGHTHAIANHTQDPATFLALILPDR